MAMRRRVIGASPLGAFPVVTLALLASLHREAAAQTVTTDAAVVARVSGSAFDSVGMKPLVGATVRLVRANDPSIGRTAVSDARGRFTYDSVGAGAWLASFLHPVLDSLRIEPSLVRIDISDTGTVRVPLTIPSARSLVAASCGPIADDLGVLVGEIRHGTDNRALANAAVEVEWPEWSLKKKRVATEIVRRRARSDSTGRFVLCGAPTANTVRSIAWSAADSSGSIEVVIPSGGYALQDFFVSPVEYVAVPRGTPDDSTMLAPTRRGRGAIRGFLTTPNGTPLVNAAVRVIGSGTPVRSGERGEFFITDAATGTQTVEARAIGFQPARQTVRLTESASSDVAMQLDIRRVQLDTVRVAAGRNVPPEVRGIERRWRMGVGRFIDGNTVRARSSFYTTDALRSIPGVFIRSSGSWGQDVMLRDPQGKWCRAILFLDGAPMDAAGSGGFTLDDFAQPELVAAVEVYPRANMVPAEYMTVHRYCGVVAVWTTYGTGNVPIFPPKSARP
jgi:Carboxypeptidase regulatory-like domain